VTVDARVLLTRDELRARVRALAARVTEDHPDGVVLVGVLKGALVFTADLARAVAGIPLVLDFLAISRYAPDSGRVRILKDVDIDLTDRDVVVVEDMVDTGLTATYLCGQLAERGPRRLALCTLLDRPVRRIVPLDVHYRGAEIPDVFVLGYGLHLAELYRNLDQVYEVDRGLVRAEPGGLVGALYGGGSGPDVGTPPAADRVTSASGRRRDP
jgi:hypoxanthine phosphoribosyltransferase